MVRDMTKLLLPIAALALAGCASLPPAAPTLAGTAWQIVSIDGVPAISKQARVDFLDTRLAATVGCNRMGATAAYSADTVKVGAVAATRMYCDKLMDQEQALGALLQAGPRFALGTGTLTLEGGNHRAELRAITPSRN